MMGDIRRKGERGAQASGKLRTTESHGQKKVLPVCRTDGEWHHIVVTWEAGGGTTRLFWDGVEQTPFWSAKAGVVVQAEPAKGGVPKQLAPGTARLDHGAPLLAVCNLSLVCFEERGNRTVQGTGCMLVLPLCPLDWL